MIAQRHGAVPEHGHRVRGKAEEATSTLSAARGARGRKKEGEEEHWLRGLATGGFSRNTLLAWFHLCRVHQAIRQAKTTLAKRKLLVAS